MRFVSALLVLAGARGLRMAFKTWQDLQSFSWPAVLAVIALYAAALVCVTLGVAGPPRTWIEASTRAWDGVRNAWNRRVSSAASAKLARWLSVITRFGAPAAVLFVVGNRVVSRYGVDYFGTDALLFAQYSVDGLFHGENPYAMSMREAFALYPADPSFVTYRIDGTTVAELSYPALSFLAFVPQHLLGIPYFDLTSLVALAAVFLWLTLRSPLHLKWFPPLILWAEWGLVAFTAGGVFDILWTLPLLGSMSAFVNKRMGLAGALFGLACSVKQTPWFAAPFLGVWLLVEHRHALVRFGAAALASFAVVNGPFILMDPAAWLRGVLVPVAGGAPLVEMGAGPIMLNVAGLIQEPKAFFSLLMLGVFVLFTTAYVLWLPRLKWLAWTAPMVVLWFNYRSLHNYYVYLLPAAYFAVLLRPALEPIVSPRRARRVFGIASGVVVTAIAVAGATLPQLTKLAAKVEILEGLDPAALGRIAELTVRVTNDEPFPIHPTFSVVYSRHAVPVHWSIRSGPEALPPGESATYQLDVPMETGAVPRDGAMHLRVFDRGSERRAFSVVQRAGTLVRTPPPTVVNPRFVDWVLYPSSGLRLPMLWLAQRPSKPFSSAFEDTKDGIRIGVSGSAAANDTVSYAGVDQAPGADLTGLVIDATPAQLADARHAAGIELRASGYCVAMVFSASSTMTAHETRRDGDDCWTIELPSEAGRRGTSVVPLVDLIPSEFLEHFRGRRARAHLFLFASVGHTGAHEDASVVFHSVREL